MVSFFFLSKNKKKIAWIGTLLEIDRIDQVPKAVFESQTIKQFFDRLNHFKSVRNFNGQAVKRCPPEPWSHSVTFHQGHGVAFKCPPQEADASRLHAFGEKPLAQKFAPGLTFGL